MQDLLDTLNEAHRRTLKIVISQVHALLGMVQLTGTQYLYVVTQSHVAAVLGNDNRHSEVRAIDQVKLIKLVFHSDAGTKP